MATARPTFLLRRFLCLGLVAAPLALALPFEARAQADYPSKPVRIIVPFAAGGVADITTRIVAEKLGDKLGQRFVVENFPGAGGINAARTALQGGTDGHTLALLTNGTAISVPLFKSLPFDPTKDFVPVSLLGTFECLFVVNAGSPYKTMDDLLKAARAKPGTLNISTITAGSSQNLTAELFKSQAKVDMVIVPTRSTGEAVISLIRDDVHLVIDFYAALRAQLGDSKIRAIAWSGTQPSPALPEVPVAQASVPGFDVVSWNALFAPAGTPQPVIDKLNAALRDVLADPDVKKRALDLGIDAKHSTPAEIADRLKSDIAKWGKVIEMAKIERQ